MILSIMFAQRDLRYAILMSKIEKAGRVSCLLCCDKAAENTKHLTFVQDAKVVLDRGG